MAWMSDEAYLLMQDTRDKKVTARSARSTRTHNGKRGAVNFPSDFMSKKELNAMNGPVQSYPMNKAISWDEFKSWPDEHKKTYILLLRKKWNAPDSAIAEMMGVAPNALTRWIKCLGIGKGMGCGAKVWDRDGFLAWRSGAKGNAVKPSEVLVEDVDETPVDETVVADAAECAGETSDKKFIDEITVKDICKDANRETKDELPIPRNVDNNSTCGACESSEVSCAVPMRGEMTFEGNVHDILRSISNLLQGKNVRLGIVWECIREGDACKKAE